MKDSEQAKVLLSMARKDLSALKGMSDPEIFAEEIFGFHAQQVTEKTLKAWLAWLGVEYSKTHDISLLLAELEQSGINADQFSDMIEYNVFAVQFRYEAYDTALDALDRQETIQHLAGLVEYVEGLLR